MSSVAAGYQVCYIFVPCGGRPLPNNYPDPLNEYFFGRRAAIAISGVFVFASVIGGACTHNWQQLLVCRVLLGM